MTIKILNPDRNTTPILWRRLRSSTGLPVFCVMSVVVSMNYIDYDDIYIRWIARGMTTLMVVMAFLGSIGQERLIAKLQKRYEEDSNQFLNGIAAKRGKPLK